MKIRKLILWAIMLLMVSSSCKKDEDPNLTSFKINKESEKVEVDTTEAVISGTYEYPGKVDRINIRVGISDQLFGSDVYEAEMNGKAYSVRLTNLLPGTLYYYRYEVDFGSNEEYLTDIYSFVTLSATPVVRTMEVLALDSTTFRVKCEVLTGGGQEVTERGICWNNYGDPTMDDETLQHSSAGLGQYTIRMENLALCKKYYVRAYAKSAAGMGYGEVMEFETASVPGMPVTISLDCNPLEGGTTEGEGVYTSGSQCTVTATANPSYTFINWTENGVQVSSDAEFTFDVTVERYLVANFTNQAFVITTQVDPLDGGNVTGAGGYNNGDECVLNATPKFGYNFVKWTKNGSAVSTNSQYSFTVTESATYVAHFQEQAPSNYTVNVSANPSNGGTVTGGGSFNHGQTCTVQASPSEGYSFANWTDEGDVVSSNAGYTFTVTGNRSLVANFVEQQENQYTITVSANPNEGGSVSGGGNYAAGQPCTLTATANSTYAFARWMKNGSEVSTSSTYTFTVTESAQYVAEFLGVPSIEIEVINRSKTSITTKTKVSNFVASSITEKGICYGQSPDLTYYSHETIPYSGNDNEFFVDITGLTPGDRYYMRAYVKSNEGVSYSSVIDTLTVYPWYYVTDIPGQSRTQSFSFAIGSKAYIGTGVYQNYMYLEDMWEYDTETGVWTQKADYPEGKVRGPMAFTLNGKAYVGLGYRENSTNDGEKMDSFYEYDPVSNSWTRKHDYPGGWEGYNSRDAVVLNGKGYYFTEITSWVPGAGNDRGVNLYEYDPNSDRWTFVNSLIYGGYWYNEHITAEAIGSNLYAFFRNHDGNWGRDGVAFYQYNMEYNTWVEKPCSIPLIYTKMESFVMGDCFYLFSGNLYAGVHNNIVYKYNPVSETWMENAISEPKIFRFNPVNLMINGKLYYGGGDNDGNQRSLWVYDPSLE